MQTLGIPCSVMRFSVMMLVLAPLAAGFTLNNRLTTPNKLPGAFCSGMDVAILLDSSDSSLQSFETKGKPLAAAVATEVCVCVCVCSEF